MCLLNGKCICYVIHIVNDARIVRMAFSVSYFIQFIRNRSDKESEREREMERGRGQKSWKNGIVIIAVKMAQYVEKANGMKKKTERNAS